jgi:hypothetical protein
MQIIIRQSAKMLFNGIFHTGFIFSINHARGATVITAGVGPHLGARFATAPPRRLEPSFPAEGQPEEGQMMA